MATNAERLDALVLALYEANATPEKTAKIAAAVEITDEAAQAKYQKNAVALSANQRAWFVMDAFKDFARGSVRASVARTQMAAQQQARRAARAAADAATAGL